MERNDRAFWEFPRSSALIRQVPALLRFDGVVNTLCLFLDHPNALNLLPNVVGTIKHAKCVIDTSVNFEIDCLIQPVDAILDLIGNGLD